MKFKSIILLFFIHSIVLSQDNFQKYNQEAYYHYQQNDLQSAIKKFSKALEYRSEVSNGYKIADTYINRGGCRVQLSSFSGAQNDYDEALKIKPEYIKIYQAKVESFLSSKEYKSAIEWADKGLAIKENDVILKSKKASALTQTKKYDESIKILHSILEDDPKSKRANRYLGHNYQMKKNWDSAVKYFSMAINLDPLDNASFFDRGIAYAEFKDTTNARLDIEKGMQLDTTMKWVGYNNIGFFIKFSLKDYKGAIEMFNKAIALNPNFTNAYCNRGFAKYNLGDLSGAYQDLKKSLNLDNKNSYAYKNLAIVYIKENKKQNACDNLKKAANFGYTEEYDDEVKNLLIEHCK